MAGLSRPGLVRLIEKHQQQLLHGEKNCHYKPTTGGKTQKKPLGVQTHVCIIIEFQTQATKPLGELRNSCFLHLLVEKLFKNFYFGHKAFHGCWILSNSFIAWTVFLVTWGVISVLVCSSLRVAQPSAPTHLHCQWPHTLIALPLPLTAPNA